MLGLGWHYLLLLLSCLLRLVIALKAHYDVDYVESAVKP